MSKQVEYLASLPERTLRASAAVAGGLLAETANVIVPHSLRRSKLYQATFDRLLRVVIELIGDVPNVYPDNGMTAGELATRKAAGNVVEVAGVLTMGWSPLWLLAIAADLTGGTRAYLTALVEELRRSGVLPADTDIMSVDALLQTLEGTSSVAADAVDLPPLNVASLRQSWTSLKASVDTLPDAQALATTFNALRDAAVVEGRSLLDVSTALGAGALRAGWQLGNVHVFEYYREALTTIEAEGLLKFLRRISTPYVARAALHFNPAQLTFTQRLLSSDDENKAANIAE